MMTDTAVQQMTDTNGQTLVTQSERQALIQKLSAKWSPEVSTRVENVAYEKSRGVKPLYFRIVENYYHQIQGVYQNRANQQQALQSANNNGQFLNQQLNPSAQPSIPSLVQPQINPIINQQPRFSSVQPSVQPRMTNPQSMVSNQVVRLREPQKMNQSHNNSIICTPLPHNSPSMPTFDLSQNYSPQQPINNTTLNDYLSQPSTLLNRYPPQSSINSRPRAPTNINGNFSQQSPSNNSSDILYKFVVGNSQTNTIPNSSSNSDRLLQKILSSNNDGTSNTMSLTNRQASPSMMSQQIRSANTTNSNNNNTNSVNSLRSSVITQQTSPSPSVIIMPTSAQTSNVQIQSSPTVTIQQSPLNNNNSFAINTQPIIPPPLPSLTTNSSTPSSNNYSSPISRSAPLSGSGSTSSPDEETINLIKYFKENINKLQSLCQKFTTEGNQEKARNAQAIHQQMVQFINNPTYESLPQAKHIRDILERASNRVPQPNPLTTNVSIPISTTPQLTDTQKFGKALTEYISRDQKKRLVLNKLFVEPLNDVINGVPHKKMRLDNDGHNSNRITQQMCSLNQSSLLSQFHDEINLLPANIFSIECLPVSHTIKSNELDDEYLSRKGLVLRCKLLESINPLIPPLRLRISTRYPDEQPEVLSLTNTMPPKLEFTDGHPYFEQISTLFISYLFKLPSQHTVTDILNIWRQSIQAAL